MKLAFAVALVLLGNVKFFAGASALPAEWWPGIALSAALVALALGWARGVERLSFAEMGVRREGALRGALVGGLVAVAVAVVGLLVLRFPPLLGAPVSYAPVAAVSPAALLLRAFVTMPLDTAIPEEVAFRGVLLGSLLRIRPARTAIALSAATFALWHVLIVLATLAETNLVTAPLFYVLGLVGAFAALFAGGASFAVLRLRTGNLAAPIAAHWAFNAVILLGLRTIGG